METQQYINSSFKDFENMSALKIRLDTNKLLEDIELYLRGKRLMLVSDPNSEKITINKVSVGKAKANDIGVQSIMSFVTAIINPHAVQGNIDDELYESYIYETHINIITNIVVNCYNWGISDEDIDPIVDFIMSIVQLFVSRTINNAERNSYGDSLRYIDGNQQKDQKQGFFFK